MFYKQKNDLSRLLLIPFENKLQWVRSLLLLHIPRRPFSKFDNYRLLGI